MAFTELADLDCTATTAIGGHNKKTKKDNPTSIEGYFIGSKQVASTKSKTGFAALHILQTQKGNVGVWGKTNLDQKLASVMAGTMVRISFAGMQETKNNPMYKYKVEVDSENTIEVSTAVANSANGQEPEDYEADDAAPAAYVDEEEPLEAEAYEEAAPARAVAPKVAAKAPDAARQAKVAALLNSTRR